MQRNGMMTEFKKMNNDIVIDKDANINFESIDDFKDCMDRGGEVAFEWKEKEYSITHPDRIISICQGRNYSEARDYKTVDELLDHELDGEPLRRIVMKLTVWSRTI